MSGQEARDETSARARRSEMRGRWRRALPIAFLLLSLGVAGFGALGAYRAQRSHQATATALIRDYSGFAAWSYERSSWQLLAGAIDGHLGPAYSNAEFALGHATEQCLMIVLRPSLSGSSCGCGPEISGSYSFFSRLGDPVSESVWVGELPGSRHQAAVVEATQAHARASYRGEWRFAVLHVPELAEAPIVAYTLVESPGELHEGLEARRDTLLYGFQVDRDRLAALYRRALADEVLLPPTLTRARGNDEVIAVQVLGPDGDLIFGSAPEAEMAFAAPVERREVFGGGQIRASVMPEIAGELIIGGLPRERTGVLILVISLAAALAVLAIVQLRREDQLALLRQDFVASVSHELRTPLAQVRLFAETLRLGRTTSEDQREWALENIDRETQRLSNLVENVLHVSRAERGVHHLEREPGDLSESVREAIAAFAPLLPERKGTIEADVPAGLVAELHDDSIRQVMLNLLDNATRYGSDGQVIRVRGSRTDATVRVDVDDEGPGVPAEERKRIFEPFRRGARSLGTVVVGSGIGLSVVRGIVEAHGGTVWVEEAPGGGARFSFQLPALHTALPHHFDGASGRESAPGVA